MTHNPNIKGVWTALATPFNKDGSIDYTAWDTLLDRQKDAGIKGVVISGTTGEGSTLSITEKLSLVKRSRSSVGKQMRVMGAIGGSDTAQSIELACLYEDAGADSLLVVTPPYSKPSLAGLKLHFSSIAEKVKIPICLYNNPGRTAQNLTAKMLIELCKIPNLQMVKDSSGDLSLFAEALDSSDAAYLSGDDLTYLGSLAYGGLGAISVISNLFPKEWIAMTEAFWKGDFQKAQALHKILLPLNKNLYIESNPTPLKAVLEELNLCSSYVRAPLAPVTDENRKRLHEILQKTLKDLDGFQR